MLILQRKAGESIRIGDHIRISISEISSDRVKIAIDAPRDLSILREELITAAETNKQSAQSKINIDTLKNMFSQTNTKPSK
ncbi:MAG: carbon storage regulator [Clostridiales bacterium]|nr:carbon storage regulator [Clostridiales bacterium]